MAIDMAKIGPSKNTRPERIVHIWLIRNRIRHRRNYRKLPGSPDIYIDDRKLAIFVNGHFWHAKDSRARKISKYWDDKIQANIRRDRRNREHLRALGIRTMTIWDTDLKSYQWRVRLSGTLRRASAS